MNCLHVISSLSLEQGGPAEGVMQLCSVSARLGHQVEVATFDPVDVESGGRLRCPVHAFGPGRLGNYGYAPGYRRWLQANAGRFDAVIVNGLWQYPGLATRQALRGSDTPYFVFSHGMLDPWFKRAYPLKHLKKWLYWPWAEYRVLRDARAVLFTCEEERLLARQSFELYRVNEAVVGYGTPGPAGDSEAQRAAFLERFPRLRGRRILLFLGRIHPKKGCDLLLDAFAATASLDPALHLVIAGPVDEGIRTALKRIEERHRLSSRVTWTGMLTGELKWGAFHCAEAFVLPSHQENFGIAVAEALACGLPVLISDKVNIWREVQEDGAGLVEDDTLEGTGRLLRRWLGSSPVERAALGRNARTCFRRRFHIEAAARRLHATVESLVRPRHAEAAA